MKLNPIPRLSASDLDRFYSKFEEGEENECWDWIPGLTCDARYGVFDINHRHFLAHRVAYFVATGCQPLLLICHACDYTLCVNPNHLFEGTQSDNLLDCSSKGRHSDNDAVKKVTKELAQEIIEKYHSGGASYRRLGREYGLSYKTIENVIRGIHKYEW